MELVVNDLREIDGEPRILDLVIAEQLGFARPRKIRDLIRRHWTELESYGTISPPGSGVYRGQPMAEYWLNEPQTLLVCALSRTPKAAEVRRELIRVFVAARYRLLGPQRDGDGLTRAQRRKINRLAWKAVRGQARDIFLRTRDELRARMLAAIRDGTNEP